MLRDVFAGTENPIGHVELIDSMGNDNRIVDAARVSFSKQANQYDKEQNDALIKYLWREQHTAPFEQVVFTFRIKAPIAIARQWMRHRTARINEVSRRYIASKPEIYTPEPRMSARNVKQGSLSKLVDNGYKIEEWWQSAAKESIESYITDIEDYEVAPEVARFQLSLGLMTEWIWQIDLHNLFHFLSLRLDDHAQKEIRVFAEAILDILFNSNLIPTALATFLENYEIDNKIKELKRKYKSDLKDLSKIIDSLLK